MKVGDKVKTKDSDDIGIIFSDEGTYSSWGEYHVKVRWPNGNTYFYPVSRLELVKECKPLKINCRVKQKL